MKLSWTVDRLDLREPFRISRSIMTHRDAVTVALERGGTRGHGEIVTSDYHGLDRATIERHLEALAGGRTERGIAAPGLPPAVRAGLDAAWHDLVARERGQSVHGLLDLPFRPVRTARTIGISPTQQAVSTARELHVAGFRVLKLKLGTARAELARVAAIRAELPDVRLLLDPNGAWTPEQAERMLRDAAEFEIEAVEQPIAPGAPDRLAELAARSPIPVIADEDARTVDDVRRLGSGVHGVNVKLGECGGITAALELIAAARSFGVQVLLGCQVSSSLGIAPAVQLSGLARWVDLDGHLLLASDPWTGLGGADGTLRLTGEPGLGVHRREEVRCPATTS